MERDGKTAENLTDLELAGYISEYLRITEEA